MDKNKFLIDLSETDRTDFGKKKFSEQSHPQKVFSAIWAVESEVNNGGFAQYFENESGETAHFVAEALDTVEAPLTAAICRRAISTAFPDGLPEAPGAIGITAHYCPVRCLRCGVTYSIEWGFRGFGGVHDLKQATWFCAAFGFPRPGGWHEYRQDAFCAGDGVCAVEELRT